MQVFKIVCQVHSSLCGLKRLWEEVLVQKHWVVRWVYADGLNVWKKWSVHSSGFLFILFMIVWLQVVIPGWWLEVSLNVNTGWDESKAWLAIAHWVDVFAIKEVHEVLASSGLVPFAYLLHHGLQLFEETYEARTRGVGKFLLGVLAEVALIWHLRPWQRQIGLRIFHRWQIPR